jgi:hypothetical protein
LREGLIKTRVFKKALLKLGIFVGSLTRIRGFCRRASLKLGVFVGGPTKIRGFFVGGFTKIRSFCRRLH